MFNLVGLKQEEHGKVDLSPILNYKKRKYGFPITTEVYPTIISGKAYIEGLTGEFVKLEETTSERNIKTIFNLRGSLSIGVPTVAFPIGTAMAHGKIAPHVHDSRELDLARYFYKEADELTSLVIKRKILQKKKLVMIYYYFTDELGHLSIFNKNNNNLLQVYRKAEEIAVKLKQDFLKYGDGVVLILSDHGMKRNGIHSNHAFYSLNKSLGWKGIKVTEFYDKILELYENET